MKPLLAALTLTLLGCQSTTRTPDDAFFVTAVFQALWFDATEPVPDKYPTHITTVDEILAVIPVERRQAILTEAVAVWKKQHAAANIQ